MNCTVCAQHFCRQTQGCKAESFDRQETLSDYHKSPTQDIIQAAAQLVDDRAGELSRLEEIFEFVQLRGYRKVGLAYCWGLEAWASRLTTLFKKKKISLTAVSCTVGGQSQKEINEQSPRPGVSCNPLSQARQLMAEGVDFAIQVGLCLGHDVLFTKEFSGDQTVLVVKDRRFAHCPLEGITAAESAFLTEDTN